VASHTVTTRGVIGRFAPICPTFTEIRGCRQALGYVLAMSSDPHFTLDASAVRSMHFMMLSHDLTESPGRYRTGPIYVHDEATSTTVYEGPDAAAVPGLVDELVADLSADSDADPLIRAAMTHLNLVMIRPFRDGNGRMARALQTLVLSRGGIAEPAFSSIEEWLGHNTDGDGPLLETWQLEVTDVEALARRLRAIYETTPPQDRATAVHRAFLNLPWCPSPPTLRDVVATRQDGLPELHARICIGHKAAVSR
jgi:fido (protein-threonine AMPylation protein)